MNLSTELFEQIATSLAAGEATNLPDVASSVGAGTQEQRRGPRLLADAGMRVRLIPLTDSLAAGPLDVALRNVSPGGAGFTFNTRINLDEQFVLLLPSEQGEIAVLCAVAYWQPVAEGKFTIGAKFTRVLRQGNAQPAPRTTQTTALPVRRAV